MKTNKRESWIDILRAFAIFLVVLIHLAPKAYIYMLIANPVVMPLFYFLSGYVTNFEKKPIEFVKNSISRLLLPWLIFSLFPIRVLQLILQHNPQELLKYCISFAIGGEVWFVTSFFITQLIVFSLLKISKRNHILLLSLGIICFILGYSTANIKLMNIWNINTAFTGAIFMILGYLFKEYKEAISKYLNAWTSAICFVGYGALAFLSTKFYPKQYLDFHLVSYYNLLIILPMCIIGICMLIPVAKAIQNLKIVKPITIFGQHTLLVYLLSNSIAHRIIQIIERLFHFNSSSFIYLFAIAILTCIAGTLISIICQKIYPPLVGAKNHKST